MGGFLENLARGSEFRALSGLASPAGWLADAFGGPLTNSGKRVTTSNALGLTAVYAAVTMISETIGMLPFKVYRQLDGNPIPATVHRSWRMIHDKPNSFTPAQRFWATVANHLLLYGNAFIVKGRGDDALVDELWIESPDGMMIQWDERARAKAFRKETVSGVRRWTDEEMLHIMGPSKDGVIGLSPIRECQDALGTAMAREEFEGRFYQRGAVLSGWIEYPGQLTDTDKLSRSFAAKYGGSGKAGGTPILEEGAQFHTVQSPLRDLQFVESKQLSRTDIATIYKIPPAFLGGTTGDSLTYSTIESNKIHFADFAVAPVAMAIAKSVSSDSGIFPQQNAFYAEFVFEGLLRADAKTRGEFYKMLYEMDSITDDEIRAKENMGPAAGAAGKFKSDAAPDPEPPAGPNGNGQIESPGDLIARMAAEAE